MGKIPDNFEETVKFVAEKLEGKQYAIRGTASLVLQDIDMNANDVDIVSDKKTALASNEIFSEFIEDEVEYFESDKFKSYFGSFLIDGVDVEIYGDWQIKKKNEEWSDVYDASEDQTINVEVGGVEVNLTTIETELKMFADMQRWNAFHKIKRQIDNIKRKS